MRYTLEVLLKNQNTALSRIMLLYTRHGVKIDQLTYQGGEGSDLSRMSITTQCEPKVVEKMVRLLNKQIDVLRVQRV